jgi:hypothetical protein
MEREQAVGYPAQESRGRLGLIGAEWREHPVARHLSAVGQVVDGS